MAIIQTGKIMVNTVVRVLPIGLYLGTLFSSMFMDNRKGLILFMGQLINDMIGLSYRFMLKPKGRLQCAVVRGGDVYYTMPAPYVQVVAFYFSFFMIDMYTTGKFESIKFMGLMAILLLTIWSRIDVECKDMLDVVLAFAIGSGIGIAYYSLIKDYYYDIDTNEYESSERDAGETINNVFRYFN